MGFEKVSIIAIIFILMPGCGKNEKSKGTIIGHWDVDKIRYSGYNRTEFYTQHMNSIDIKDDGTYTVYNKEGEFNGIWKIIGKRLRMEVPPKKDISGELISGRQQSEWEYNTAGFYMYWKGTPRFANEKVQINFSRKPIRKGRNEITNPIFGEWTLSKAYRGEKDITTQYLKNNRRSFSIKAGGEFTTKDSEGFISKGKWVFLNGELRLIATPGNELSLRYVSKHLEYTDDQGFTIVFVKD